MEQISRVALGADMAEWDRFAVETDGPAEWPMPFWSETVRWVGVAKTRLRPTSRKCMYRNDVCAPWPFVPVQNVRR